MGSKMVFTIRTLASRLPMLLQGKELLSDKHFSLKKKNP